MKVRITKPERKILQDLYETQHLTSIQIAELYGVSKRQVLRWMKSDGIKMRLPGRGLATQGKQQPTREELVKLIYEQYCSYDEIAQMFGATTSQAVTYWLDKYSIPHPAYWASRQKENKPQLPTKEEFLHLYEHGWSIHQIAQHINVTSDILYTFCQKQGIQLRPSGWFGGRRIACQDGHLVLSVYEQRVDDWLYEHNISHVIEPPLPFDRRYRADFLANGWYIEIWGVRDQPSYIQRKLRKLTQYKEHGLPLIEIYNYHFDNRRNEPWARRLQAVLTPP